MYKVSIYNDGQETIIHSPYSNELKVDGGNIKKGINKIDSFVFGIYMNNPGYKLIKPLTTLIRVENINKNKVEFEGRILHPVKNMESNGLHGTTYECEGELAYLHDSQQRHLEFQGTPLELFQNIINYHNSQVEPYKQFQVGNMTVSDPNNYIYLYLSAEEDTFDSLKSKLVDNLGAEICKRKENGINFLDLLEEAGELKQTKIELAVNLKSMSVDIDPTDIVSRLTPLGARIETEGAIDTSQARLTIENVNNGLPYLDDPALIEEFGIQGGSEIWDDITIEINLLSAGQSRLSNQKTSLNQYTINAVDLEPIGLAVDSFELGNTHPTVNPIMSIDENLRIIGLQTNINNPQDASLTIGDKFKTLNEYQAESNKSAEQLVNLESTVGKQSLKIGSMQTELGQVNTAVQEVKLTLSESDLPALEQAVEDLNIAINNLNVAVEDIPVYDPATITTDGLMASTDKVKLDGLESYDPATELETGLMSNADKAKLNLITILNNTNIDDLKIKLDLITVIDPVDLNDIVSRLETLENA